MDEIKCPYCDGAMKWMTDNKIGILSLHDRSRVTDKDGSWYARLPARHTAAQLAGSYISGVPVVSRKCEWCGHIALFSAEK